MRNRGEVIPGRRKGLRIYISKYGNMTESNGLQVSVQKKEKQKMRLEASVKDRLCVATKSAYDIWILF